MSLASSSSPGGRIKAWLVAAYLYLPIAGAAWSEANDTVDEWYGGEGGEDTMPDVVPWASKAVLFAYKLLTGTWQDEEPPKA